MRAITKQQEPLALTYFRNDKQATDGSIRTEHWGDNIPKEEMNDALLREQYALCAYCMSRINKKGMRIEHWLARSTHGTQTLTWSNLLGVCPGDTTLPTSSAVKPSNPIACPHQPPAVQSPRRLHCDNVRGNQPLCVLHPADPNRRAALSSLCLLGDGHITSDDPNAQADLQTLNLNHPQLIRNRVEVIERLRQLPPARQDWSVANLQRLLRQCQTPDARGELPPYVEVAVRWLQRQLKRRAP